MKVFSSQVNNIWTAIVKIEFKKNKRIIYFVSFRSKHMNKCVNHKNTNYYSKCRNCHAYICIFQFLKAIQRKKIGFCSEDCVSEYYERRKKIKRANRKKSLPRLISGIGGIIISFIFMDLGEKISSASGNFISNFLIKIIALFSLIGGFTSLIYFFSALISGNDPDHYSNPYIED